MGEESTAPDSKVQISPNSSAHFNRALHVIVGQAITIGVIVASVEIGHALVGGDAVVGIGIFLVLMALGSVVKFHTRSRGCERPTPPTLKPDRVDRLAADLANEMDVRVPSITLVRDQNIIANVHVRRRGDTEIYLNENLFKRLDDREARAILAHELAHIKTPLFQYIHPVSSVLLGLCIAIIGLTVMQKPAGGNVGVGLIGIAVLLRAILKNHVHRRYEIRADRTALEVCDSQGFISALETIATHTRVPLDRDTTVVERVARLFQRHPPLLSRIQTAADWEDITIELER